MEASGKTRATSRSDVTETPGGRPLSRRASVLGRLFSPLAFSMLAVALINLVSWLANLPALRLIPPKASPMSLNSSVLFCLISLCLLVMRLQRKSYRPIGVSVASLILAVGLLTGAEYVFGLSLGIDGVSPPFRSLRMSPFSATAFVLIGSALLFLLLLRPGSSGWIQYLGAALGIIALFNIVGYLFSVSVFYQIAPFKPISLASGFCFLLCAICILLLRPQESLMRLVLEESSGGSIIRRFLLFVVTLPIVLGGLTCQVICWGLLPEPHAMLLLVLSTIVAFMALLLINGRAISLAETEKKRAEVEARKIESNYRELFDNISNCVCVCRPLGIENRFLILDLNKAAEKTEGISKEEAVGKEIGEALPALKEFGIDARIRKVWATGRCESAEHSLESGGAETSWRRSGIYRLPSGEVVTIYDDITEVKKAEKEKDALRNQLYQAQKLEAIGRLAGGISHDFNNFLTVITGYCDALGDGGRLPGAALDDLEEIKKAAAGATNLVRQLLAFSRKQLLKPEVVDMNATIESFARMLKALLDERSELVLRLQPELAPVLVDTSQLVQVIMNLVVNARDAMPDGGILTIETRNVLVSERSAADHPDLDPGEYVLLTVTDTGKGMDQGTLSHLFEPFFTTKAKGLGTGLGLSTAYGIISQSNGTISARSELGKGSTFQIFLPAVPAILLKKAKNGDAA